MFNTIKQHLSKKNELFHVDGKLQKHSSHTRCYITKSVHPYAAGG